MVGVLNKRPDREKASRESLGRRTPFPGAECILRGCGIRSECCAGHFRGRLLVGNRDRRSGRLILYG